MGKIRALLYSLSMVLFSVILVSALPAQAGVPSTVITSSGPLSEIWIGNELSCQVNIASWGSEQFYPPATAPGDCGTFLTVDGTLFAPDFGNHDRTAVSLGAYTPFTPASQSAVTGTGTNSNPFTVVTSVTASGTGIQVTETNTYVVGDNFYETEIIISNSGSSLHSGVLYRAADCYLGGSDSGYGAVALTTLGSVACTENPQNVPMGRVAEFIPVTPDSSFLQDRYLSIWTWISNKAPFPNTCECLTLLDTGAGLSWKYEVGPGKSTTFVSRASLFAPPPTCVAAVCGPPGTLQWEQTRSGPSHEFAVDVAPAGECDSHLAGNTYNYAGGGNTDVYVQRFDCNGLSSAAWTGYYGGSYRDESYALAAVPNGPIDHVYVVGRTVASPSSNSQVLITRWDSSANAGVALRCTAVLGSPSYWSTAFTVTTAPDQGVYAAGLLDGLPFVSRFESDCSERWRINWTPGSTTSVWGVTAVEDGADVHIYVTGDVSVPGNSEDMYVRKYTCAACTSSTIPTLAWERTYGGPDFQRGREVAASASAVYVGGAFGFVGSDSLLVKWDSAGNLQWARQGDFDDGGLISGVTITDNGDVYTTGEYARNGIIPWQGFVARHSALDGSVAWSDTWGGVNADWGQSVATTLTGDLLVAGGGYNHPNPNGQYNAIHRRYCT